MGVRETASGYSSSPLTAAELTATHRDPFDRLWLGVAQAEDLVFLTADAALIALASKEPRLPLRGA
jgi:PIN domain nuclease of toxin-antitoxin system